MLDWNLYDTFSEGNNNNTPGIWYTLSYYLNIRIAQNKRCPSCYPIVLIKEIGIDRQCHIHTYPIMKNNM